MSVSKKQIITQDDIDWAFYGEENNINKTTGDKRITDKTLHIGKKFEKSMIYRSRYNNINTHKIHVEEELQWHATKRGWWEYDKDPPIMYAKNKDNLSHIYNNNDLYSN
jgi:hypothetical protein